MPQAEAARHGVDLPSAPKQDSLKDLARQKKAAQARLSFQQSDQEEQP